MRRKKTKPDTQRKTMTSITRLGNVRTPIGKGVDIVLRLTSVVTV